MAKRRKKRRKGRKRASTRSKRRMSMSSRRKGRRKRRVSRKRRRNPAEIQWSQVAMEGVWGGLGLGAAGFLTGLIRGQMSSDYWKSIVSIGVPAVVAVGIGGVSQTGQTIPGRSSYLGPVAGGMLLYSGLQTLNLLAKQMKWSAQTQRFLGLTNASVGSAGANGAKAQDGQAAAPAPPAAQPSTGQSGSQQGIVVEIDNSSMPPKVTSPALGVTLSLSQLKSDDNGFLFYESDGERAYLISKSGKPLTVHQAGTIIESDSGFQASVSGMMPPYGGPGFPGYDNPSMPQMPILAGGMSPGYGTMGAWDPGYGTIDGFS